MRALGFVMLAACGDNLAAVDEPATSHGGDRIDLFWFEVDSARENATFVPHRPDDGFGPAIRMFDTARGEPCELVEWADRRFRCTPGVGRTVDELSVHDVPVGVFTDATCSGASVRGLANRPGYFLHGEWIGGRFFTSALLHVESTLTPTQTEYYERRDGACVGPLVPKPDHYLWPIAARAIAGSELVAFSLEDLSTSAEIGHRAYLGDDGTLLHSGYYDRARDTSCSLVGSDDGTRCFPSDSAEIGRLFADADCTQRAVAGDARFAHAQLDSGCFVGFELDEPLVMQTYELDGTRFIPAGVGPARLAHRFDLPAVEVALLPGGARMAEIVVNDAPVGLYDFKQQVSCSARNTFDQIGQDTRCIPSLGGIETDRAFVDAACTRPIDITPQSSLTCGYRRAFVSRDRDTFARVGEPLAALFTSIDGSCVPLVPPDGLVYHAIGAPVPRDAFVPATLVHAR